MGHLIINEIKKLIDLLTFNLSAMSLLTNRREIVYFIRINKRI